MLLAFVATLSLTPPAGVFATAISLSPPAVWRAVAEMRRSPPLMRLDRQVAPPAPPIIHDGGGGGGDEGLVLREISAEARRATLLLWQWQWQQRAAASAELERYSDAEDLEQQAAWMSAWQGDQAPSGWFGRLKGRGLGAFVGGRLEGMVGIRYEIDSSSLAHFAQGKHVMVVDGMLLAPTVPDDAYLPFKAALTECLLQLGQYHEMNVYFWSEFGI